MATSDRLDCLLEEDAESAALCIIRSEREGMIEACVEDAGRDLQQECQEFLSEPSPVVLAARIRALEDGSWLDLWACHAPSETELAPEPAQLIACGLGVLEKIAEADCSESLFSEEDCEARWALQAPRSSRFLTEQLKRSSD
jgi:hypothetical protein